MPKCDFNKGALQWVVSFAWVLSCKFAASQEHLWTAASEINYNIYFNENYLLNKIRQSCHS